MQQMTGAEITVKSLDDLGATRIFSYPLIPQGKGFKDMILCTFIKKKGTA